MLRPKSKNEGTLAITKNIQFTDKGVNISIKYHFIREIVNSGRMVLEYWPTGLMVADLMTKLAPARFV